MRIAKNNLAYPLVRDTLTVLGSSKCKVLSVLDLNYQAEYLLTRHCYTKSKVHHQICVQMPTKILLSKY